MSETQFLEELTHQYEGVRLDDPVEAVMRRGRALRRARRSPLLALAAVAVTSTAIAASTLGNAPSAFATWTQTPRPATAAEKTSITHNCASAYPQTPPLTLVDARGDVAFALFIGRDKAVNCTLIKHNGSWANATGGSNELVDQDLNRYKVRGGKTALVIQSSGDLTSAVDDAHAASTWGWVTPQVKSVIVRADGHTTRATITHGAFAAWWPHDSDNSNGGNVTAYNATGQPLTQATIAPFG